MPGTTDAAQTSGLRGRQIYKQLTGYNYKYNRKINSILVASTEGVTKSIEEKASLRSWQGLYWTFELDLKGE